MPSEAGFQITALTTCPCRSTVSMLRNWDRYLEYSVRTNWIELMEGINW
jgi:hypothetical protein